jgi:hypothetical protein
VPIAERIADVERALAAGEAAGLPKLVSAATSALRVLYGVAGRYQQVLAMGRRQLDGLAAVGSRREQADIMRTMAVLTINISGRFEEGLELARRSHALSVDASPHQRMHATWPVMAALRRARASSPPRGHGRRAHARPGQRQRLAGAIRHRERGPGDRATPLGRQGPGPAAVRPQHALTLLEALVALEDWPSVGEFLPQARARVAGNALLPPACDRTEGLAHAQVGRPAEAVRALRRALARFERLSVPFEAARTREHLAALESPTAARPLLKAALSTYERLACTPRQHAAGPPPRTGLTGDRIR